MCRDFYATSVLLPPPPPPPIASLSVALSLSVSLSLSLSLTHTHTLSLPQCLSVCLSPSLSFPLSLSLPPPSLSVCLSLSRSLSLSPPTLSVCLSLPSSLRLCLSVSLSLTLPLPLSLSLSLPSLSLSLSLFLRPLSRSSTFLNHIYICLYKTFEICILLPFFFVLLPVIFGTRSRHIHVWKVRESVRCLIRTKHNERIFGFKLQSNASKKQQLTFHVFQACFRTLAVILVSDLLLLLFLSSLSLILSLSLCVACVHLAL